MEVLIKFLQISNLKKIWRNTGVGLLTSSHVFVILVSYSTRKSSSMPRRIFALFILQCYTFQHQHRYIRSWFGLINQVSNYAHLREHMKPFWPFLSPRCSFSWDSKLNDTFESSKAAIVHAIKTRVEIFYLQQPTCLCTDWSKQWIGYFSFQTHCICSASTQDCSDGWHITLAGSRTTLRSYRGWSSSYILVPLSRLSSSPLGCCDLPKPLIKIFGDRTMDEFLNTRFFPPWFEAWFFNIVHLPAKTNHAADAISRRPLRPGTISCLQRIFLTHWSSLPSVVTPYLWYSSRWTD